LAKNLKLNIKNVQLAKALEIKKVKLSTAGKKKATKAAPKTSVPTEEAPKLKARIIPPEAQVEAKAEEKKVASSKEKHSKILEEEVVEAPIIEKKVVEEEKKFIGQIIERKVKTKEEKKKEEKISLPLQVIEEKTKIIQPSTEKETLIETENKVEKSKKIKKNGKEVEEEEVLKEGYPGEKKLSAREFKAKKQEQYQTFDSRARHGLSTEETERWRKKRSSLKQAAKQQIPIVRPDKLAVKLPISVKDLAAQMKIKASEIIKKLFSQGVVITLNDILDDETTVQVLGQDFNCDITIDRSEEKRLQITSETIKEEIKSTPIERLIIRPPIVTFMGHVDHGKTSIIDTIRKSKIAAGEAGAITQHIGAFTATTSLGKITILDTPGHEAFSEMRARGANVTDIVVLVIAGDEGIREQTVEALTQAKEAKATIIVAINKSDKIGYDPEKVYRQLADYDLLPEAWGGNIITINCSAVTGKGINELLEMISLQAEVLELKADPAARARGTILESEMHKGLGAVATLLVQNGTLKLNDAFVFGNHYGRVKTMQDEYGKNLTQAGPSTPIKITGLSHLAEAGCSIIVVSDEKEAKDIAKEREEDSIRNLLKKAKKTTLESLLEKKAEKKIFPLIIRADVQGSLEALEKALLKIHSEKINLDIISSEVGEISESDIELAAASNATILGFHVGIESHSESLIKQKKITVILHDIIYHAVDDVKKLMKDRLDKIPQENDTGKAEVKAIFKSSQVGKIAGCLVIDGIIKRGQYARLKRDGAVVWNGKISSLKRIKEDVKEVQKGVECGILLENFTDLKENDIIEAFDISYLTQEL
jgi:translation initiation factor IF-2